MRPSFSPWPTAPPSRMRRVMPSGLPRSPTLARVGIDEGEDLADRLLEYIGRRSGNAARLSNSPVQALELIRENRPLDAEPRRKEHVEWISLHLRGDRAAGGQAHPAVVRTRRGQQRRPMPRLLVTRLGRA